MMKRMIYLLLPLSIALFITGCFGPKIDIDDSSYGFVQYIAYDKYRPDEIMIYDLEDVISVKETKKKVDFAEWLSRDITYAVDKEGQLYTYDIVTDEKGNMSLECEPLDISGIKEYFLVRDNLYIWTKDGRIYEKVYDDYNDDIFVEVLSNVSEYRLYGNYDSYGDVPEGYNASAITNDSRLYVWGTNGQGQIGNGECSYNFAFHEYSDKYYDPYLVLENVKEYKIDISSENYYKCAAITLDDELFVWGALPRLVETVTINIGGGQTVDMQIEEINPAQKEYSPVKKLDNVKSFEFKEDGILAITNDGQEILINEIPDVSDDEVSEANYRNTRSRQNRWDPVFDSVMISLKGSYDGNEVQRIYGTIENNMNITWYNCRLTFLIYDKDGQPIDQICLFIGNTDIGERREFSTDSSDSLFMYKASQFELVEVAPNVVH